MKKYLALVILPILASCDTVQNKRPSYDSAVLGETTAHRDLAHPHMVVNQTTVSTLDVTEDGSGMVGNIGRRQVNNYSGTVIQTGRRGSRIVSGESRRFIDTGFDVVDGVADLGAEQIETYPNIVMDASGRVLYAGGTIVGATMMTYGNVVDSAWNGVFNGLLRGVFIDTKPYMVGSANDLWPVAGMPGSGWRGRLPQMPPPVAYVEETSGKSVTYSK